MSERTAGRKLKRALLISLVGGAVFALLTWQSLDVSLWRSLPVGLTALTLVAIIDYLVPDQTFTSQLFIGFMAGLIIGFALYLVFPWRINWLFLVVPSVLFTCGEVMLERLGERFRRKDD